VHLPSPMRGRTVPQEFIVSDRTQRGRTILRTDRRPEREVLWKFEAGAVLNNSGRRARCRSCNCARYARGRPDSPGRGFAARVTHGRAFQASGGRGV
jgi:hypothetical protein